MSAKYRVVVKGDGFLEPLEVLFDTEEEATAASQLAYQIMQALPVPRQVNSVKAYVDAGWIELPS